MSAELYDMHCHLDFLPDSCAFANEALGQGLSFFSTTVTPGGYAQAIGKMGSCSNVRVGVGLHPWWVADGSCGSDDVREACCFVRDARYVGEIGLDFGKRHIHARDVQIEVFRQVVSECAREGGKLISIHAVNAADVVLDVLEETDCLRANQVILHWFSGSDPALQRAIAAGCWFSVGERMLATRRGREYARRIPEDRLLLETDFPPQEGQAVAVATWRDSLLHALEGLEAVRQSSLAERLACESSKLFA